MRARNSDLHSYTKRLVPWMLGCLALLAILAQPSQCQKVAQSGPVVRLSDGAVEGKKIGEVTAFEGIPFAAPPVGGLRWREPQPVVGWPGTRDATQPSRPCIQNLAGVDTFIQPLAHAYGVAYSLQQLDPSEDCLYLNIWTPRLSSSARLPVMVWIHGGSNRIGSGSEPGYDGALLASNGVIVVTFNYRLGVLGFFVHPELTAESPHHSSGNYALLDQLAALRWVKRNIARFGGDPENVTLFGESAGSLDAITLMSSPLSKNLFRRVIAESGSGLGMGSAQALSRMEALGIAVGEAAGSKSGSQIDALRKLPPSQVLKLVNDVVSSKFKGYNPNSAVVDGWVLPQLPARAFASGTMQHVELLVGLNAREFSAFRVGAAEAAKASPGVTNQTGAPEQLSRMTEMARSLYGSSTDLAISTYKALVLSGSTSASDQMTTDITMACPIGAEAALTNNVGQRVFVYRFDRSIPGKGQSELGAFHAIEIPYVFGTFGSRTFSWLPFIDADHKLSQTIQTYWTNFAKTGDPNGPSVPHWIGWAEKTEPYMSFDQNGDAVPQQHFSPPYCDLSTERLKSQLGH